ncbi:DUF3027 domain-containing protein [Deinococcus sp.]|uniref:DUF3027 domain-containing protein n=1 Tax=Deinococcus sp. TaxID=47478 RepID=UPI00391B94E3
MKPLMNDDIHLRECHQRWLKNANRDVHSGLDDHELETQCEFCAYYINLSGEFKFDWGVCSNKISPFDGRVMFEHDGCEYHVESD